jgi:hypothetical protein
MELSMVVRCPLVYFLPMQKRTFHFILGSALSTSLAV